MKGGKQPGAGRPLGSTTRPQLRDFYNEKELKAFIRDLKETAKTDNNIKKFIAEQIFGKAVQPLSNDDGKPLLIKFDNSFNETTSETKNNSSL